MQLVSPYVVSKPAVPFHIIAVANACLSYKPVAIGSSDAAPDGNSTGHSCCSYFSIKFILQTSHHIYVLVIYERTH